MKMTHRFLATGALATALAALTAPAIAATICVKPTGSTTTTGNPCYASLGYALAGTSPQVAAGDVITVAAGVYKEPAVVSIGNTLTGLHVVGPSSAIIDNEIGTGNTSDIIDVYASDVLIQGLTLRNGRGSFGIWVSTSGDNFSLSGTTFNGVEQICVYIAGDDAIVKSSKFYGCGQDAIEFYGKNISVTGNVFRGSGGGLYAEAGATNGYDLGSVTFSHNQALQNVGPAVYLHSLNGGSTQPGVVSALIQSNTISNSESYGIEITQDAINTPGTAVVTGNKISNVYYSGIYVSNMDANTITANSIKNAYDDYAVIVYGGGINTISSNIIDSTYYAGIYLTHATPANDPDGSVIKLNKIHPEPDSAAIYAYYGKDMTIANNTLANAEYGIDTYHTDNATVIANNVTNTLYTGIIVDCYNAAGDPNSCTGATIATNKVTGVQDDPGISFYGYGVTGPGPIQINSNIVKQATYQCFYLRGDNMTLMHNQAFYCGAGVGEQGFYLEGTGSVLTANTARYATGDGFFIYGDFAVLTSNVASNNNEDGFDIHASSAILNSNHATLNAGSGFEVEAGVTGPTGANNVATGNGVDRCDAVASTFTGTFPNSVSPAACDVASGYIGD